MTTPTPGQVLATTLAKHRAELATAERNAVDFPELAQVWQGTARTMRSLVHLLESADADHGFSTPVHLTVRCEHRHKLAVVHASDPYPVLVRSPARSPLMYPSMIDDDGQRSELAASAAHSWVFGDQLDTMLALDPQGDARSAVLWCRCGTTTVGIVEVRTAALDTHCAVLVVSSTVRIA